MLNPYSHLNAHMRSPYMGVEDRRETEIEYCFRIAREQQEAIKAEARRQQAAMLRSLVSKGLQSLRGIFSPRHGLLGH